MQECRVEAARRRYYAVNLSARQFQLLAAASLWLRAKIILQDYEDSESLSVQQLNVYADEEICILCPMYITLAHLCPLLHCH